jgi:predicted protein tyrosine phosphatase
VGVEIIQTAGDREAYIPASLPTSDETGTALDFTAPEYANLCSCASGVKAIWDDHVTAVRRLGQDPSFAEYRPAIQAQKLAQSREVVAASTLKSIARLEAIANSAEREAAEIRASLLKPATPDSNQAGVNVRAFAELPRDQRVAMIHDICRLLATADADPQMQRHARDYLRSVLDTNPYAGLVDETSRKFATEVLVRTANPAKHTHARRLEVAARSIKAATSRVRTLVRGEGDVRARLR